MLEAIASQYYAEKYEGAERKDPIVTGDDIRGWLNDENLEYGVYRTGCHDFINPSKEITDAVAKNRVRIAELMKQNQR